MTGRHARDVGGAGRELRDLEPLRRLGVCVGDRPVAGTMRLDPPCFQQRLQLWFEIGCGRSADHDPPADVEAQHRGLERCGLHDPGDLRIGVCPEREHRPLRIEEPLRQTYLRRCSTGQLAVRFGQDTGRIGDRVAQLCVCGSDGPEARAHLAIDAGARFVQRC